MRLLLFTFLLASGVTAQPNPEAILQQAVEFHRAGDMDGAIRAYREYLKAVPGNVQARSNLGAALARLGHYDEAIVEYEQALKGASEKAPILLNLGLAYYKSGRPSQAAAQFEQAPAGLQNPQVTMLLASCYLRLGQPERAVKILSPLEAKHAGEPAFDYLYGTALIQDKQPIRGSHVIDRILRRGDSAQARLLLAITRLQSSDFEGAQKDFEKAIELDPKLPEAHARYGQLLLTMGDSAKAAEAFRQELAIDSADFMANLNMGVLAKQDQNYSDAREYLNRALRARPGDTGVLYQIATLDLATGELERARQQLESLIQTAPSFMEAHSSLSTVYFRLDRAADAERERQIADKLAAEQRDPRRGSAR